MRLLNVVGRGAVRVLDDRLSATPQWLVATKSRTEEVEAFSNKIRLRFLGTYRQKCEKRPNRMMLQRFEGSTGSLEKYIICCTCTPSYRGFRRECRSHPCPCSHQTCCSTVPASRCSPGALRPDACNQSGQALEVCH